VGAKRKWWISDGLKVACFSSYSLLAKPHYCLILPLRVGEEPYPPISGEEAVFRLHLIPLSIAHYAICGPCRRAISKPSYSRPFRTVARNMY